MSIESFCREIGGELEDETNLMYRSSGLTKYCYKEFSVRNVGIEAWVYNNGYAMLRFVVTNCEYNPRDTKEELVFDTVYNVLKSIFNSDNVNVPLEDWIEVDVDLMIDLSNPKRFEEFVKNFARTLGEFVNSLRKLVSLAIDTGLTKIETSVASVPATRTSVPAVRSRATVSR